MRIILISLLSLLLLNSVNAIAEEKAIEQKAVLITGASSGLGLKMTELLSENGFYIYATARKEVDLKRLNEMKNVEAIKLDVLKPSQIEAAVKQVTNGGRGLYGLINNAGVAIFGPMIEVPVEQLDYQLDVNVLGPYRVLQAFAPMIIESKGRIATTGSIAGTLASSMFGHYSMSKHAIEAYTDSLASEMERFGVHVSVIEPGNYASNIGQTAKNRILDENYWSENSRYKQDREGMLAGLDNVLKGADPLPVAEAALDIMQSDTPKRRYMVVANERQAQLTLRRNISKLLEQNQAHQFKYDNTELLKMFEEELSKVSK